MYRSHSQLSHSFCFLITVSEINKVRYCGVHAALIGKADFSVDASCNKHSLVIDKVKILWHRYQKMVQIHAHYCDG